VKRRKDERISCINSMLLLRRRLNIEREHAVSLVRICGAGLSELESSIAVVKNHFSSTYGVMSSGSSSRGL
jgi:hypothetical protein